MDTRDSILEDRWQGSLVKLFLAVQTAVRLHFKKFEPNTNKFKMKKRTLQRSHRSSHTRAKCKLGATPETATTAKERANKLISQGPTGLESQDCCLESLSGLRTYQHLAPNWIGTSVQVVGPFLGLGSIAESNMALSMPNQAHVKPNFRPDRW